MKLSKEEMKMSDKKIQTPLVEVKNLKEYLKNTLRLM